MPPLPLYDYQLDILDEIKTELRQQKSLMVAAPTGSGKTVVLSEIVNQAIKAGRNPALLVHRQELVKQSERAIYRQAEVEPGVVWQSRKEWGQPVTILAQDTLSTLEIPPGIHFDLLIIDEAHHAIAPGWQETINRLRPRFLLGFSATPFRQDREPLSPRPFAKVIRPITPQQLIERGLLGPAIIESPIITGPDGLIQPISQANNLPGIYRRSVDYALAQGRTRIVLYVSQTKSHTPSAIMKQTCELLNSTGVNAGVIGQDTSSSRRDETINRFTTAPGAAVLLNYMALTEGTDLPAVDCVIIGRHTESESTIIQMIGRGLRKYDGKRDCLVLDYTGRADMTDIIHYWRLDRPKEETEKRKHERQKGLDKAALAELATSFPRELSAIDQQRARYPWFRPYPNRPLLALELWQRDTAQRQKNRQEHRQEQGDKHGQERGDSSNPPEYRYLTVEPDRRGARSTRAVTSSPPSRPRPSSPSGLPTCSTARKPSSRNLPSTA